MEDAALKSKFARKYQVTEAQIIPEFMPVYKALEISDFHRQKQIAFLVETVNKSMEATLDLNEKIKSSIIINDYSKLKWWHSLVVKWGWILLVPQMIVIGFLCLCAYFYIVKKPIYEIQDSLQYSNSYFYISKSDYEVISNDNKVIGIKIKAKN